MIDSFPSIILQIPLKGKPKMKKRRFFGVSYIFHLPLL